PDPRVLWLRPRHPAARALGTARWRALMAAPEAAPGTEAAALAAALADAPAPHILPSRLSDSPRFALRAGT
ncbi:MAG: hypothetical protein ACOCY0_00710, partial [Roseicyclus sp.]